MAYTITNQIPPLAKPGTRSSHVNRAFNAALGDFLNEGDGGRYDALYEKYIGIAPRFRPSSSGCDRWSDVDPKDHALKRMLDRGTMRFGYVEGAPYVFPGDEGLTGFDYELAEAITVILGKQFGGLHAEWVEVKPSGPDQADKLGDLYAGLVADDFDVALAGQMMLPSAYLKGLPIQWTSPTALLFTAITYTGLNAELLDVAKLESLVGADVAAFQKFAAAESSRLALELRIFSVVNPGPSPGAAQDLVYALHRAGGRAVWVAGDVADSFAVMYQATDHFAVGDSLASGAQTLSDDFHGTYLNIPAQDELWPIAGFTAGEAAATQPEIAVYAEHSDSKKPMVLDPSLPPAMQGWNVRVFNRTEVHRANGIHLESGTGVVTLEPGLYHITATSLVTYDDLAGPRCVTTDAEPFGGYSRLRYAEQPGCDNIAAIAIGTMSTANMIPSTIDTWLDLKDRARIVLEHQVGGVVDHIYLQGIWEKSSWHVFARIAIQKV